MSRPLVAKSRRLSRPQLALLRKLVEKGVVDTSPSTGMTIKWAHNKGYADFFREDGKVRDWNAHVITDLGRSALALEQRLIDADERAIRLRGELEAAIERLRFDITTHPDQDDYALRRVR